MVISEYQLDGDMIDWGWAGCCGRVDGLLSARGKAASLFPFGHQHVDEILGTEAPLVVDWDELH